MRRASNKRKHRLINVYSFGPLSYYYNVWVPTRLEVMRTKLQNRLVCGPVEKRVFFFFFTITCTIWYYSFWYNIQTRDAQRRLQSVLCVLQFIYIIYRRILHFESEAKNVSIRLHVHVVFSFRAYIVDKCIRNTRFSNVLDALHFYICV